MRTTLNEIFKHRPCSQYSDKGGWGLLLKNLNKSKADDEPLDLMTILKSNGIQDAVWALRCFDYIDYCLFLAAVAESVLHIFEKNNNCKAPRLAIQGIRDYKAGLITKSQLKILADAAAADADAADADDAYAAAYVAYVAYAVAYAAADAVAYADAYADADAVAYAAADAYADAAADAAAAAAAVADAYADAAADAAADADHVRAAKWIEIESLFIKYFK